MFGSRLARPQAVTTVGTSGLVFYDAQYHTAYTTTDMETLDLETRCVSCQYETRLTVRRVNYYAWMRRTLVQVAFPNLHPAQRELFFVSGMCAKCWDAMISPACKED